MWCEKLCMIHKNPVNCFLKWIAGIILVYGLWQHSWKWIIVAIIVAVVGHIIQAIIKKKDEVKKRK